MADPLKCPTGEGCPFVGTIAEIRSDVAWIKKIGSVIITLLLGNGGFLFYWIMR